MEKIKKKNRDRTIDLFKSILVVGMISAHVFQFFNGVSNKIIWLYSQYINMITFSGFLFCFGYSCNLVYMNKKKGEIKVKFKKNCIRLLCAFYISGLAYRFIVTDAEMGTYNLMKIILLWDIPGYSEFLLSFFIINILTYLFFNPIKRLLKSKYIIVVIIVALLSTFIPYNFISINQIGLIIGSTRFSAFPIIQYSIFYLFGMYFQKNKIKFNLRFFVVALICSGTTIVYYLIKGELPSRFPPSIFWILGPMIYIYIYIYYLLCMRITRKYKISKSIYIFGENTLYFLVSSNLIIFLASRYLSKYIYTTLHNIIFIVVLLVSCVLILIAYKEILIKSNLKIKIRVK